MTSLTPRRLPLLLLTTLCLACAARAQSGGASVTASGAVSEIVALSFEERAETFARGVHAASVLNEGGTLVINISGAARDLTRVSVPIRIRSNTAYRLLATVKADGANLKSLSVDGARPTGALVAADAVEGLSVASMFDWPSSTMELLRGPRVSLGGTLGSPSNALEVTLSAAVEPRAAGRVWVVALTLKAEPAARL